ncbi:MAG: hypothetical protein QNJ13_06890 [Paracoccaceae bacterium]|nr:hypothetical protein [Paracoccaceae bacterium]
MNWASGPGMLPVAVFSCPHCSEISGCFHDMDDTAPFPEGASPETKLRWAIRSLEDASAHFEERIIELSAADAVTASEVKKVVTGLREAFTVLLKERQNFERDVNGRTGSGIAEPLDLDAARAEIGGLLDRLRASGDAGGVPGQSEP